MSLYAANNIARGIQNYATEGDVRMGGLIANVKDLAYDRDLIERFAERIGTHVVYYLEWNKVVYEAERRRQTVVRHKPDDPFVRNWFDLAAAIEGNRRTHVPRPMADDELDVFLETLFGFPGAAAATAATVPAVAAAPSGCCDASPAAIPPPRLDD
jgi:nitrogenase iron protein NifH